MNLISLTATLVDSEKCHSLIAQFFARPEYDIKFTKDNGRTECQMKQ